MRGRVPVALIGLLVWVLAGCSMAENAPTPENRNTPGGNQASGGNQADIRFSQEMIPHHQQSIQISELAAQRATSNFVTTTAEEITTAETAEITLMSDWLRSWKADVPSAAEHAGHGMPGMLSASDIASLENVSGPEFDRIWLATMAKHLRNGVQMARTVLDSGQHTETRTLAQNIVEEQGAKIAEINDQLSRSES